MSCRVMAGVTVGLLVAAGLASAQGMGTAFNHQGRLFDGGSPASGPYDLRCILYDAASGGSQVGPTVTLDDVAVSDGLFLAGLDFGAVFGGSARWLEISARPGASTGGYTTLGPRQELKPAPHASFSAAVPWTGVAGKPAGFADDVDNDSGGTVVNVGTGAGLAGGPIVAGSGTVSVAAGGIGSAMIASGAVGSAAIANGAVQSAQIASGAIGLAQINQAQVQARVGGTCPAGTYLRGVAPDGSLVCTGLPNPHTITVIDDPPVAGSATSDTAIAIGTDGLPVIAFFDEADDALKVAKCGNLACSQASSVPIDSTSGFLVLHLSMAVGNDGRPVIAYFDDNADALKVAKCGNAACTAGNVITPVDDAAAFVGMFSAIAVPADGRPVVSYYNDSANALRVAKCGNAACTAGNTITDVDNPANDVGTHTSIAIGADGLPVISYHDASATALNVAKCGNAACTAGNVLLTLDNPPGTDVGRFSSIAIGADGAPVVSYRDDTNAALKFVKCGNASCSAGNSGTTVDATESVGTDSSIDLGADGLPVISYHSQARGALKVARCGNAACNAGNVLSLLDDPPANVVGTDSSIAVGADGLPVISYRDYTARALKVAKCGNAACSP